MWCSNNWRMERPLARKSNRRPMRLADILWHTREADVFAQIANDMGLETADRTTPKWFQARTQAAARIIAQMSEEEKDALAKEGKVLEDKGISEDHKRRYVI